MDSSIKMNKKIINIKKGIFTVAIDDAPHHRNSEYTWLIFVFCKGIYLENVIKRKIRVDGINATQTIIDLLNKYDNSFNLILTHGITFGGFNVVNIDKISSKLGKPLIAITENVPKGDNFQNALKNVPETSLKEQYMKSAGELHSCKIKIGAIESQVFFYIKNINVDLARSFIKKFSIRSKLPEQLLLAHKIASMFDFDNKDD
ncbi:MAG: endonuclease dU [Promethearchaeota archaeon]